MAKHSEQTASTGLHFPMGHSSSGTALKLTASTAAAYQITDSPATYSYLIVNTSDTPPSVTWGNTSSTANAQPKHKWYLGKNVPNVWQVSDTDAADYINVGTSTGSEAISIGKASSPTISVRINGKFGFNATPVVAQTVDAVTNNITSGGVNGTLTNWTSLTTYSTDAAAIRNAVYQLGRSVVQITGALRAYGLGV